MRKINNILNHLEEYFTAVSLFFISLLVFTQAFLRYGFNTSISWSDEVSRYMIIWIIFIGSSIAVREKAHAAVDAITAFLPGLFQRIFSVIVNLIAITFCVFAIWSGYKMVSNSLAFDTVTATLGIPMAIPYLAIPVGASLMLIRFIQLLVKDVQMIVTKNYDKTTLTEEATKY